MFGGSMKYFRALFILIICLPSLIIAEKRSGEENCFLELKDNIKKGVEITIITNDSSKISGKFYNLDLLNNSLSITQIINSDNIINQYGISDINQIEYKKRGVFKPKYAVLGMVGGALIFGTIGYIAGSSSNKPCPDCDHDNTNAGIGLFLGSLAGGLVGLVVGTILPTELKTTITIDCK